MSGSTPATNARFIDVGGGTIAEMLADQTQFLYDPTTGASHALFNSSRYLNLGGNYHSLSQSSDVLNVEFTNQMTKRYAQGLATPLVDPVTGIDLGTVSNAGVMMLLKLVFDVEFNARAMAAPPTASYTAATSGLTVVFTDTSVPPFLGTITSWAWNFGDAASMVISTDQNPTYTYSAAGTYPVQLKITGSNGKVATVTTSVIVA